jgi:hypothetical protein
MIFIANAVASSDDFFYLEPSSPGSFLALAAIMSIIFACGGLIGYLIGKWPK